MNNVIEMANVNEVATNEVLNINDYSENELITVNYANDRPTVSGRDLHAALEVGTKYNDWFPRMCEYGFTEGLDFNLLKIEQVQLEGNREVKREITDHQITIAMAKEICMIQRSDAGKKFRQYFIKIEEAWNTPEAIMARALTFANKSIENLKIQNQKLNVKVLEMQPKAEFFDAVADSKDAIEIAQVAKILNYPNIGRNKLFEFLRNEKILMNNNLPYQQYIDRGYFRTIEQKYNTSNGEIRINIKTLVYQKGVDYIRNLLDKRIEDIGA